MSAGAHTTGDENSWALPSLIGQTRTAEAAMTFHEEELLKIQQAISGSFQASARHAVAQALCDLQPKIARTRTLPATERWAVLKQLGDEATAKRNAALQAGAWNRGHPQWAAAAVCESWVQELLLGAPDSIAQVEQIIDELSRRGLVESKTSEKASAA